MMVCVSTILKEQATLFKQFYFDLHKELGLPPDESDPGELILLNKLKNAIELVKT